MKRHSKILGLVTLLLFGPSVPAANAGEVLKRSLKDAIVGSWSYVLVHDHYVDGDIDSDWGPGMRGNLIFDNDGRFSEIIIGEARRELRSSDPRIPDALLAVAFGTYTVNEAERIIIARIERSGLSGRDGTEVRWQATLRDNRLHLVAPLDHNRMSSQFIEVVRTK